MSDHDIETVAIYLPSLAGGGAERVMVSLANGFVRRGLAVDLILARAEGPYLPEVAKAVRIIDLGCSRVLTSLPGLVRYLRQTRPTALLTAMSHANVIAVLARDLARVPTRVVISERDHFSASLGRARGLRARGLIALMRRVYRRADAAVAVSEGVADDMAFRMGLPRNRIDVIFNAVDVDEVQARADAAFLPPWLDGPPGALIVAVGRLAPQKGFTTLISAFARVRAERPARLVILGEGPLREALEAEAKRLGVAADVGLPGFVENPFPVLRRADLFVLSSRHEGFPNVLIQAMACGTPVVATECPSGPAEILDGGRWGRLVPVDDDAALAKAISATLDGPDHPDVAARAAAFNLDRAVTGYLDVLLPENGKPRSECAV